MLSGWAHVPSRRTCLRVGGLLAPDSEAFVNLSLGRQPPHALPAGLEPAVFVTCRRRATIFYKCVQCAHQWREG